MSDAAEDPTGLPSLDADSAWFAAYALGLAYTVPSQDRVHELEEAARGRPELLDAARERLDHFEGVEPGLCDRAQRLLENASALSVTGATVPSVASGEPRIDA